MNLNRIVKYSPLIFFMLTFILTFFVNVNISYFGDDYYYLTYSQGTFSDFINYHVKHYTEINGRFIVHILATFFLSLNIFWWRILNSLMLAGIVYFGAKLASYNTNNRYSLLYASVIFFSGICLLHITIARESVYWVTGSFNYIYPILMLILYWYMLLKFCHTGKSFLIVLLLSIIASASVEQVAMMVLGITILTFLTNYFTFKNNSAKKAYKHKLLILLLLVIIGASSVVLSPSVFIRYALENSKGLNLSFTQSLKAGIRFLINTYIFSKGLFPYNILLSIVSLLILFRFKEVLCETNKCIVLLCISIIILSMPIIIINRFVITDVRIFDISKSLSAFYMLITNLIIFIVLPLLFYKRNIITNWSLLPISVILLLGSQLMILASPVYGYRNIFCGIVMIVLYSSILISNLEISNKVFLKNILNIFFFVLIIFSIINMSILGRGYYLTEKIQKENIVRIKDFSNGDTPTLNLKVLTNDDFGWSMPYYSQYHEEYYKKYYNITSNIYWTTGHSSVEI